MTVPPHQTTSHWLIRISQVFGDLTGEILSVLGATVMKKLGSEYYLIQLEDASLLWDSKAAKYLRWKLPVHHAWPCNPEKMPGFVEKAATTLYQKFSDKDFQAIFMGPIEGGLANPYYRKLASNLRGRTLQLFPKEIAGFKEIEAQSSTIGTLFCLVGQEGLYAGVQSPKASNGFYPGGTKFVSQGSSSTISRAGAKIAEALHYLLLDRSLPKPASHWLELGASPGGMTSELLSRGYQVTAIDRAPLDARLDQAGNLRFIQADVADFRPDSKVRFDAILSDMNGGALEAIAQVNRLASSLVKGGLVIFTLKTPGAVNFSEMNELYDEVTQAAAESGLVLVAKTHLTYNRLEFTLFFENSPDSPA